MKFLTIPLNGSSWRDPLIYAIELDEADEGVADVQIVDSKTREVMASFKLYNIAAAEIDIAPYLRCRADVSPARGDQVLSLSTAVFGVLVMVNGVAAPGRTYYRAKLDVARPQVLSSMDINPHIAQGGCIRKTIYARSKVVVNISQFGDKTKVMTYEINTDGRPVEFVYTLTEVVARFRLLIVAITVDGRLLESTEYVGKEADSREKQLIWYNDIGGVESYIFPRCEMSSREAVVQSSGDGYDRVVGCEYMWQLTSAYEPSEELERIRSVVFRDAVYVLENGVPMRVNG